MISTRKVFVFLCVAIHLCLANQADEIQVKPIDGGDRHYKPLTMKVSKDQQTDIPYVWETFETIENMCFGPFEFQIPIAKKELIAQDYLQGGINVLGTVKQAVFIYMIKP